MTLAPAPIRIAALAFINAVYTDTTPLEVIRETREAFVASAGAGAGLENLSRLQLVKLAEAIAG